jgi:hypothetical protein
MLVREPTGRRCHGVHMASMGDLMKTPAHSLLTL